jgi:hypothetical protein
LFLLIETIKKDYCFRKTIILEKILKTCNVYLLEEPLPPLLLPPEDPLLLLLPPPEELELTLLLLPPPDEREPTLLLLPPPDDREETLLLLCPPDDRELIFPEDLPDERPEEEIFPCDDRDADFREPDPEEFPALDDLFEEDEIRSRVAEGVSPREMVDWDDLAPGL